MGCIHCNSTGVCKFCMGSGKNPGGRMDCIHCHGSGICSFCGIQAKNQGSLDQSMGSPQQQPMRYPQQMPSGRFDPQNPDSLLSMGDDQQIATLISIFMGNSKLMKGSMKAWIKNRSKFGGWNVQPLMKPLFQKFITGTDREKMAIGEMFEAFGENAQGVISDLGKELENPNPTVRATIAKTLEKLGKTAAPAEQYLLNAVNDDSPQVSKAAVNALKNFRKLTKEEKENFKRMEEQEKELLKETEQIQKDLKKITVNLPQGTNDFSKYQHIFFMSHALADFDPWVEKCIKEISTWPGCYCWTCERDISPGEDWLTEIYKGLDACTWYLLFWSDKAENSKWTNEEMKEAKTRNVSNNKPLLSVVNLGKDKWPVLLNRAQGAMIKSEADLIQYLANLRQQVGE